MIQGGTGPRFPDRGLVGRLDLETAKKKIGPLKKSCLNRLFYDFECRYKHNMCKRSLTSVKKREYNHIFKYFHDFTATVAGLLAPAFLGVTGPSQTKEEPSRLSSRKWTAIALSEFNTSPSTQKLVFSGKHRRR